MRNQPNLLVYYVITVGAAFIFVTCSVAAIILYLDKRRRKRERIAAQKEKA